MASILDALKSRRIFFDGAMGTELQKRGLSQDPAILNLSAGNAICEIHREYLAAGADVITANTFGAYSHKHANAAQMIEAALAHGRTALESRPGKWLAMDLGPTGLVLKPYGDTTPEKCYKIFKEAATQGAACGADLILIETMMDLAELKLAVKAAKKTGLPIFASMSFNPNGRTMMGNSIQDMAAALEELGVSALGMNCGFGPDVYVQLGAELSRITSLPIMMQPNAGMPLPAEPDLARPGAFLPARYSLTAEDFASSMAGMTAQIMGGCCGTSPAHIAALVELLN